MQTLRRTLTIETSIVDAYGRSGRHNSRVDQIRKPSAREMCKKCKQRQSNIRSFAKHPGKEEAMKWLIRGGIVNPCDLSHALGMRHTVVNKTRVEILIKRVERQKRHTPLPEPHLAIPLVHAVFCLRCRAEIDHVPCISCTHQSREPTYQVPPALRIPKGSNASI